MHDEAQDFRRYAVGGSCWLAETCPEDASVHKAWMSPALRPLLREDFGGELIASLEQVAPLVRLDEDTE